jgi:HEAT repeat protein
MGKRLSVEEKLSSIRGLRGQEPSAEVSAELRLALRDKSNHVVAAAATIAGERKLVELSLDLEAAFERFLVDPGKTDKQCRAKTAVVQCLDKLEHERPEIFLRASRHVQFEPVWGGQEDAAAPLRAAGILALARIDVHRLLPLLVDALVDPQKEVRIAAAQALGYHGTEPAQLLLRLKSRVGDNEPEVISECLFGLLSCSPRESLAFVAEFLDVADTALCEAAILALGRSRYAEAFELLKAQQQRHPLGSTDAIFLAMAMLRLPAATEYLLETIAAELEKVASAALSALLIHRYDPGLRERIAAAVRKNGSGALRERFERVSASGE